jgi:hypothetical protein
MIRQFHSRDDDVALGYSSLGSLGRVGEGDPMAERGSGVGLDEGEETGEIACFGRLPAVERLRAAARGSREGGSRTGR